MLKSLDNELTRARKMNITVDDDEAYARCSLLLSQQFELEEQKFNKIRKKLKIRIQTVEEHIDVCQGQKQQREKEKIIIEEYLKQIEVQTAKVNRRHRKQQQIREDIEQELKSIESNNLKLQELKQKSYQQKNLYLKLQQMQMNMMDEIGQDEQEQRIYYDFKSREDKYRQLTRILQKLHNKSSYSSQDIEGYLKEKISEMSILRTNLLSIDEKLQQFDVILEQQNYIIDGLKYKSQNIEEVDRGAYKKYQSKYEDLYFNRNNNLDNWKSYKNYLEELLKRNKIQSHLMNEEDMKANERRSKARSGYLGYVKNQTLKTEPNVFQIVEEDPYLSPSFKNIHTPQLKKKMSQKLTGSQIKPIKLPKLVKMSGDKAQQARIKQNLKSNIKRMINESDISLESVDSNEESMGGDLIQVQFHKK